MLMRLLVPCVSAAYLSACAYWPPEGYGGEAETFETEPAYWSDIRKANKSRIECFDRALQGLYSSPVADQNPAALAELSIDWTRATRAHAGHLDLEAQDDLVALNTKYQALFKRMKNSSNFILISVSQVNEETCS